MFLDMSTHLPRTKLTEDPDLVPRKLCSGAKTDTYITRLIVGMKNSLQILNAKARDDQLEDWAFFIHESMSNSSRNYHSVQHVFDLAEDQDDPILVLSAFFHDCIYYHVDGGFSDFQASILKDVIIQQQGSDLYLNPDTTRENDFLLAMVLSVFGFKVGQKVDHMSGLNEYLSAVVAVRQLESVLDRTVLVQIACCIEATIPFRPTNEQGTPLERLYARMQETNMQFNLGMKDDVLVRVVQLAATLQNLDVANFGTTDRAWFLDNTWSLLPETNESLRRQHLYTIQDFQNAVYKLNGFFSFLKPHLIFVSFRGVPSPDELDRMTTQATRNIEVARTYVCAKLLSTSVVAAFAALTGGDAPISLFMGDLPSRKRVSRRLEDALPSPPVERLQQQHVDLDVYNILLNGRTQEMYFDTRQSPLAAYLYGWMGDAAVKEVMRDLKVCPMETENAIELLSRLPRKMVERIAENTAKVAVSRADAIRSVMANLPAVTVQDVDNLDGA